MIFIKPLKLMEANWITQMTDFDFVILKFFILTLFGGISIGFVIAVIFEFKIIQIVNSGNVDWLIPRCFNPPKKSLIRAMRLSVARLQRRIKELENSN